MSLVPIPEKEISKENQRVEESAYRFGEFMLSPAERLLARDGNPMPLPPKAFDALLLLVRHAGHLVRKTDLIDTLWPSTFVSEANLTNTIVCLRKALGHDAIQTVSRHGYRFMLPVQGEPGVAIRTYERFVEAKQLIAEKAVDSSARARDLLWLCIAENPGFAAAWAWLGRSCWIMGKFGSNGAANIELAEAAFRRAFAIDPELACAHQFYTPLQTDTGQALGALARLRERVQRNGGDPESYVGLVQVLRFCGLLPESVEAHRRAAALDPTVRTSVAHTLFLMGEYTAAIDTYGGLAGAWYLDAAAWASLGDLEGAGTRMRERLRRSTYSDLMSALMMSLLAITEGRYQDASACMSSMKVAREPEVLLYLARHYSYMGDGDEAIRLIRYAADSGFVCAPSTLQSDRWFGSVRAHRDYNSVVADMTDRIRKTQLQASPFRP